MPTPNGDKNLNEIALIWENKSRIMAVEGELKHIREDQSEIKDSIKIIQTNHLSHIQSAIEGLNKELSNIKISIAKITPTNKLITKIIEVIITGVIIAMLAVVIGKNV